MLPFLPFIDLQTGWPSPSLLSPSVIETAAREVLRDPQAAREALLYGPAAGHAGLREEMAQWLTSNYQPLAGEVSSSRILISCGASQNLAAILQEFSDPLYTRGI